jgi:hypothetical protein
MSPFRHLEFCHRAYILGKYVDPCFTVILLVTNKTKINFGISAAILVSQRPAPELKGISTFQLFFEPLRTKINLRYT